MKRECKKKKKEGEREGECACLKTTEEHRIKKNEYSQLNGYQRNRGRR
jgi:hypothetical protein